MESLYLAPDFMACHAAGLSPDLDIPFLLARGERRAAVRAALLKAACLWKMQGKFIDRAPDQLRPVLLKPDLDTMGELSRGPLKDRGFVDFVTALNKELVAAKDLPTEVAIKPDGASVAINGREKKDCTGGRCRFLAKEGDEVIVTAQRFGYATLVRTLRAGEVGDYNMDAVDRETERQVAAAVHARNAAPYANCASTQLANATAPTISGSPPTLDAIGAAAARNLGRVLVLVDVRKQTASAIIYDDTLHRVVARREETLGPGSRRGIDVAPDLAVDALREWRRETATHWYKSWKFWAGFAVVAAAATGTTVYVLKEIDYDGGFIQ